MGNTETPSLADTKPRRSRLKRRFEYEPASLCVIALLGTTLGLLARLREYVAARSLWIDELLLISPNLVRRSWFDLTQPLDNHQSAPILFLWAERAAVVLAGPSELALRALPAVCGIAVPVGVWVVGRRLLGSREALVASMIASLSGLLIYYSNEVKQYGVDTFATIVLVGVAVHVIEAPATARRWWRLGVVSTMMLSLSQASVFVLPGVLGALALHPRLRSTASRIKLSIMAAVWGVTFFALYWLVYRTAAHDPGLLRVWSATFLTLSAPDLRWRVHNAAHAALTGPLAGDVRELPLRILGLALAMGILRAGKAHGTWVAVLLLVPLIALAGASMLGKYPIAERFVLFAAPLTCLAYGSSIALLADLSPAMMRASVIAAAAGALLVLSAGPAVDVIADPLAPLAGSPPREESRDVVREAARLRLGQPIYVTYAGESAWLFYSTSQTHDAPHPNAVSVHPESSAIIGSDPKPSSEAREGRTHPGPTEAWANAEVARMAAVARPILWLLSSHDGPAVVRGLLSAAHNRGAVVTYGHLEPGAALYRLRFPARPDVAMPRATSP